MISSVSEVLATFTSALRSRWELVFEHLALSHQVMVMQRSRRKPQFSGADRFFWILLSTVWDRWPKALVVAKPATVLRWRREGIGKCWRRAKGRRKVGRPPLDAELVSLIGQMSQANCLWGAPRIHGELLKLGLKVSEATVAKYMVPRRLCHGPGWRVFLRNQLAGLQERGLIIREISVKHFDPSTDPAPRETGMFGTKIRTKWYLINMSLFVSDLFPAGYKSGEISSDLKRSGSRGRARTCNIPVNSRTRLNSSHLGIS